MCQNVERGQIAEVCFMLGSLLELPLTISWKDKEVNKYNFIIHMKKLQLLQCLNTHWCFSEFSQVHRITNVGGWSEATWVSTSQNVS